MKKYLMMGIAALALASCSKDDITYVNPDEAKYEMVFVNRFGTPNPNHTWGFGSETRAFTRSAYPNANQWASQGYSVPDPLTAGQKARVQYYFQMVQNPGGTKDYGQIDFFVQQVYDGGDDPMPGKSLEKYLAADGNSYITSGEHMDHLTAGSDNEHIYNFNNGTCSTNPNVGNNGAALDTDQHSDEIMLMLNTKTDKFGYANSDASFVRTDRYRQVAGSVIDDYCNNNSAFQTWLAERNITDDKVVDDWNRSFIGFDFDMLPDDYVFAGNKTWENGKIKSMTYDYFSIWLGDNTLVWDGNAYVEASTIGEVVEDAWGKRLYPYMPGTTKKVKMLNADANQYCGTKQADWGDDKWEIEYRENGQYIGKRVRVDYMLDALRDGFLPDSSSNKKWYKIGGCADGYYSDWIVSFMPAGDPIIPDEEEYDYRVMAEDLSTNEKSDFDFNDVVFDVKYVSSTIAKVKVRAAGGVYPIRIAQNDNYEIHALLGGGMTMLNTFAGDHNDLKADDIEVSGSFGTSAEDAQFKAGVRDIKIEVSKDGSKTWVELTAPTGKAASKIGVPVDVDWCDEYHDIDEKWGTGAFAAWVGNETNKFWTSKTEWK